jgi:predicted aspartyl protease
LQIHLSLSASVILPSADNTTVIFEFTKSVSYNVFVVDNPPRVVVELPNVEFRFPEGTGVNGAGLVTGFRYGQVAQSDSRVVIDTSGPVIVERADVTPAESGDLQLSIVLASSETAVYQSHVPSPGHVDPESCSDSEQTVARSQWVIGRKFATGDGLPQDDVEAAKWYQLSSEQAYARAQFDLGKLYEDGRGVPQDHEEAKRLFELSAKQGFADALDKLATLSSVVAQATLPSRNLTEVNLDKLGGTLVVPVLINNVIALRFTVDSGATDVCIPVDVVMTLMRAGTIESSDFIGSQNYTLADGSIVPSTTFRIHSLKVGDRVVENVAGSISPANGVLLLGQSFLTKFSSWSIDNRRQMLVLAPN